MKLLQSPFGCSIPTRVWLCLFITAICFAALPGDLKASAVWEAFESDDD